MEVMRVLIDSAADIEAKTEDGSTALHFTASHSVELVRLLIDSGADVKAKDESGWTALHYAAVNDEVEVASQLIDSGANVTEANGGGNTAREVADDSGSSGCVALFENIIANMREGQGDWSDIDSDTERLDI